MVEYTCLQCGKLYETTHKLEKRFCNNACAIVYRNKVHNYKRWWEFKLQEDKLYNSEGWCYYCGLLFPSTDRRIHRYCSEPCLITHTKLNNNYTAWWAARLDIIDKVCLHCYKLYTPRINSQKKFCSKICRQRRFRKPYGEFICPNCNMRFQQKHGSQEYCTVKCQQIIHKREIEQIYIPCKICEKQFVSYRKYQKFCSIQCRRIDEHKRGYIPHSYPKVPKHCFTCSNLVPTRKYKFCSNECKIIAERARFKDRTIKLPYHNRPVYIPISKTKKHKNFDKAMKENQKLCRSKFEQGFFQWKMMKLSSYWLNIRL